MADTSENIVNICDSRRVTLSDVHRVACGYTILIDQSSLDKCDETSKRICGPSANTCTVGVVASAPGADIESCRAAVCARIISLVLGHSVRSNVINQLTNMLNKGVVPVLSSEELAGAQLLAVITGVSGNCYRLVDGKNSIQSSEDALASIDCDNFVLLEYATWDLLPRVSIHILIVFLLILVKQLVILMDILLNPLMLNCLILDVNTEVRCNQLPI